MLRYLYDYIHVCVWLAKTVKTYYSILWHLVDSERLVVLTAM